MSLKLISQQKDYQNVTINETTFLQTRISKVFISLGNNCGVFNIHIWVVHEIYNQLPLLSLHLYVPNNFFPLRYIYNRPQRIIVLTIEYYIFFLFFEAWRARSELKTSVIHRFLHSIINLQNIFHTFIR